MTDPRMSPPHTEDTADRWIDDDSNKEVERKGRMVDMSGGEEYSELAQEPFNEPPTEFSTESPQDLRDLPRWLEAPLDEGSIQESIGTSESDVVSYNFYDNIVGNERVTKRYRAGMVYETTLPLNDDSSSYTTSRPANGNDLIQLGLVL